MWQVRPGEELEYEVVTVSDEGAFLVAAGERGLVLLHPHQVHEVCDVCQEEPTTDDPLGHFRAPLEVCAACAADPGLVATREAFGGALVGYCDHAVLGVYVLAHGQCGLDQGLELA